MATVYAHMKFTDRFGEPREIGDEFELPTESDQDRAEFERLKAWGVLDTVPPDGVADDEDGHRTPPRDRKSRTTAKES